MTPGTSDIQTDRIGAAAIGMPTSGPAADVSALINTVASPGVESGAAGPENRLVQVRLGVASSLFMALRVKHAASAGHSMRVAIGCSAWTHEMGMSDIDRDHLEVAALLHDVGKIGVPDHILHKPGELTAAEVAVMNRHWQLGMQILSCCCAPAEILDTIKYAGAWFDGSRGGFARVGKDLPLGSRILSIVDAFDAMTTDHVYRRARSREAALVELFEHAGTQFDPDLVRNFSDLHEQSSIDLHAKVSQRWLETLAPELANQAWELQVPTMQPGQIMPQTMFQQKLLDSMHNGVVFVDSQCQIFMWNQGAERLSGISGSAAYQRTWTPSLVAMRDDRGRVVRDENCPVRESFKTGAQTVQRLSIAGRNGNDQPIDLHVIPVLGRDGTNFGATLLLQDALSETSLEQRCENLHSQATKDPLTQVANRAEFDRVHRLFIDAHVERNLPCSLIISDIDLFKQVNDNYGHQAGDEAIVGFASLLKREAKHGDLVARYGGEEFVMLCADCNNATAAARAEKIRRALAEMAQPLLGSKCITASFGVTENQPGDTPETMLRRADRALLQAKATGRNRTVQLGVGSDMIAERRRRGWWPFESATHDTLVDSYMGTEVPRDLIVEKLRGFVADRGAQIKEADEDRVELTVEEQRGPSLRRSADRPISLVVLLEFTQREVQLSGRGETRGSRVQTQIHVTIRPRRNRDRRVIDGTERARELLRSLQSYLVAYEIGPDDLNIQ